MYIITIFYTPPRLGVIVLSCYFMITWITLTKFSNFKTSCAKISPLTNIIFASQKWR